MKTNKKNIAKYILLQFLILLSAFTVTGCYSWWEDEFAVDTTKTRVSLGTLLYNSPVITSLEKPSQVLASQGLYSGSIKIHWTQVENAESYRIERAKVQADSSGNFTLPEEDDFSVLQKNIYSNNFTDVILSSPSAENAEYSCRYYYRISAENLSKGYESSEFTDINEADTEGTGWLLCPPSNVTADKGKSTEEIKVTWNGIKKASYYEIYRSSEDLTGSSRSMESYLREKVPASSTYYIDRPSDEEKGKDFYYYVKAVLSTGSESACSASAMGYTLTEGAPAAPSNVKVIDGYGSSTSELNISWEPVTSGDKTITYNLFRSSSLSASPVQVANGLTSTSYTNNTTTSSSKIVPGVKYYYYVQTVATDSDLNIEKSSFSESGPESQSPAMGFLLSPPASLDIGDNEDEDYVLLKWTPSIGYETQATPYSYNIYYDSDQTGSYAGLIEGGISSESLELDESGFYSYLVPKKSFYKIAAVNASGLISTLSSAAAPYPKAPENVTATKTSGGELVKNYSANSNGVYPVKITWTAPENETPYGYNIYRSTKTDSSFRKLNEEIILSTSQENGIFTFIDENSTAQPGTYYYYKIISLNELGSGKKSNNPADDKENSCRGYGALTADQWFREYNKTVMNSQSKLTLMHKANDMDKLGSETINGDISGTLGYKAAIAGLGAEITMPYKNYADFYINNDSSMGIYFCLTGNTDTSSNMSANGSMHGTVNCSGMYPGTVKYDNLKIKNGAAGDGYYEVSTFSLTGESVLDSQQVDWKVGEENK